MLEAHFRAIADEGDLPIVVYNVPSRTGTNVDADTFLRLAEHPRVVAVKEASGNLEQIARICRDRPRDVAVLAGDDAWTLPILALGGDGVVSVASQRDPGRDGVALRRGRAAGDWDAARRIHERWLPLFLANFRGGPNPVPAKAALLCMGLLDARRGPGAAAAAGRHGAPRAGARRSATLGLVEAAGGRHARPIEATAVGEAVGMTRRRARRRHSTRRPSSTTSRPAASAPPSPTRLGARRLAVRPEVKAAILACFADRTTTDWTAGPLPFRDRAAFPPRDDLADGPWRIVPGGTAVRARRAPRRRRRRDAAVVRQRRGLDRRRHDGRLARARRVVRPDRRAGPPVGRRDASAACSSRRARARSSSRTTPSSAPGRALLEGVLVGRRAVIGAGVTLTGTSRLYDLVRERVLEGTTAEPLVVPPGAVVVPGTRRLDGAVRRRARAGRRRRPLLVKDRDAGTDARVALEDALR